jgi:hypothetical protein
MVTEKIYAEILKAISALGKTDAAEFWSNYLRKENCTGDAIRNTSTIFAGDVATILYALKSDLEEDMRAEQAKKSGKKNYSAVKRFMKMCEKEMSVVKPHFSVAHQRKGKYFACTGAAFYMSSSPDGLTFAPKERKEEYATDIDKLYYNIAYHFDTNGTAYKIPYTVAQLKAWKKTHGKQRIPFSIGYALPVGRYDEQSYAAVNVDYLIMAMEITDSDTLLTDDKYHMAMENENGDRVGMLCVKGKSPDFQKI